MIISDEVRYDAYILCKGYTLETIKNELALENSGQKRFPRTGYCENDILLKADKQTLEYTISNYNDIKSETADSWQNYFLSRREKERLSL